MDKFGLGDFHQKSIKIQIYSAIREISGIHRNLKCKSFSLYFNPIISKKGKIEKIMRWSLILICCFLNLFCNAGIVVNQFQNQKSGDTRKNEHTPTVHTRKSRDARKKELAPTVHIRKSGDVRKNELAPTVHTRKSRNAWHNELAPTVQTMTTITFNPDNPNNPDNLKKNKMGSSPKRILRRTLEQILKDTAAALKKPIDEIRKKVLEDALNVYFKRKVDMFFGARTGAIVPRSCVVRTRRTCKEFRVRAFRRTLCYDEQEVECHTLVG